VIALADLVDEKDVALLRQVGAALGRRLSVKVEDALGARKFGDAGACNDTLDPDLTVATICQAQPGATLDEIHLRRWILEYPQPCRIGTRERAANRLDGAIALDYGRALTDRRTAVVAIHDSAP